MKNREIKQIIFGAGQLGLAIMDELVSQGQPVRIVNRSGRTNEPLPGEVEVAAADLNRSEAVARACQGAEVVFFCAQPPYDRWPELFPPLAASVIDGVAETGARLVFGSNLYMYGPTGGRPINEGLPYAAETRKGRARAAVDTMLLEAHQQGKLQVTIGRAADFYGPRVTDSLVGEILFGDALAGKTVNLVGDIDAPHTLTYIRDFARALVVLSQQKVAYGQAWHVPSAATVSMREFVGLVQAEIGQRIKFRTAGKLTMRLVGMVNPVARETVEMMYEFEEPFVVDDNRFTEAFGRQTTPHREAVTETVAWYRAQRLAAGLAEPLAVPASFG